LLLIIRAIAILLNHNINSLTPHVFWTQGSL